MEGFIVLHRKMLDWEWYDDTNMVRLWLHLLFKANYKNMSWHRKIIKRGQLVTGREILAHETGLSVRQVRTCLDRLAECGCITKKTTNKYTLITICKYSNYQDIPETNDQQTTNKRPTNDQQTTTSKQRNKETSNNTHTRRAREEEFFDEAFSNETWREAIRMRHKLTEQQVSDLWEEYKLHSRASNKAHDSARDVQEHFNLWILSRNKRHGTDNRDYNSDEARAERLEGAAKVMRQLYENGKQYYREVPDH
jgi:hypothetical protein